MASPVNFPTNPSDNDQHFDPDSGRTWMWLEGKWVLVAKASELDFTATAPVERNVTVPEGEIRYEFNISSLPRLNEN